MHPELERHCQIARLANNIICSSKSDKERRENVRNWLKSMSRKEVKLFRAALRRFGRSDLATL